MGGYRNHSVQNAFVRPDMISGGILLWHGTIASIPSGFVLCDGNNGTPDLRDKFIVGATQDDAGIAKTSLAGALTKSGGTISHDHNFTTDGHFHIIDAGAAINAGANFADSTGSEIDTGTTDTADAVPPYYALAYIMKT